MPINYDIVDSRKHTNEEEKSPEARFDVALEVYRDLIRDPAFARIQRGGILPQGTEWHLISHVRDLVDGFEFPHYYRRYYNNKGSRVKKKDMDSPWVLTDVVYLRHIRARGMRRCLWKQGRSAKEMPDPRNNKASYFSYDKDGELVRHSDCEFCHGELQRDKRMFLYCTSCNLIFE